MSIYTNLAQKLSQEDYILVTTEITKWCREQAVDYADSRYVRQVPTDAYRQALQHLLLSLTNKEERI